MTLNFSGRKPSGNMRKKIKEKWHLYLLFVRGMKLKIKQTTDNNRVWNDNSKGNIWSYKDSGLCSPFFSLHIIFLLQRNVRIKLITLYNMWEPFENFEVLYKLCTCANNY